MTVADVTPPVPAAPSAVAGPAPVGHRARPSGAVHQSGSARAAFQTRYSHRLILLDLAASAVAAGAALGLTTATPQAVLLTAALPVAWLITLMLNHGYDPRYLFIGTDEYQRVLHAGVGLTAAIAIGSYGFDITVARGYVLLAMPVAVLLTLLLRYWYRTKLHRAWAAGRYRRRVVLVGHAGAVETLARQLQRESHHGMEVVAACLPPASPPTATLATGLPVRGTFAEVATAARHAAADTVLVLPSPEWDGPALRRLAWALERYDLDLILASALLDVAGDRTTIRPVDGLPMLHVEHPRLTGFRRMAKVLMDRVGAAILLLVLAPLLLVIAVAVRWGDPRPGGTRPGGAGSVLSRQVRVGRDGRLFTRFTFRTTSPRAQPGAPGTNGSGMGLGGPAVGATAAHATTASATTALATTAHATTASATTALAPAHARATWRDGTAPGPAPAGGTGLVETPVGRWLRRWSLAGLPQLLNVVRGEMSLVGPRPQRPHEAARHSADLRRGLRVKPGMTGLWQVAGGGGTSSADRLAVDVRYLENWSLTLDLVILLRTVTAVSRSSRGGSRPDRL